MTQDLSILTRAARGAGGVLQVSHEPAETAVPVPRVHWKTRVLLPAVVAAATIGLVAYAGRDALLPATPVRVAPAVVKTDVTAQPAGAVVVQAPGWVEADPFAIAVTALSDGIVEEVLVLEGEDVAAGQVVARLVARDAEIALARSDGALGEQRAALAAAQAKLDEAQRNWDHPIELTRKVESARGLVAEKRAELARWPAESERDAAHAVYLEAEWKRVKPLHAQGQASEIELIEARQAYLAQKAQVDATRLREDVLKGQLAALEADLAAAEEDLKLRIADTRALEDARAALDNAKAAVAAAVAAKDEAALRLERMDVKSPAGGRVINRLVEPGSKVMLGMDDPRSSQIVRLYDPKKLQVRIDVPLNDAARVGVGQNAEVIVEVLPDRTFTGHVTRIVNEADIQKNTLQFKVAIDDPDPAIKPEMLARARFLAAAPAADSSGGAAGSETLLIPRAALRNHGGSPFVWLADAATARAQMRHVTVGSNQGDRWVVVTGGLHAGDRVVVEPPANLADGARIRIEEEVRDE